MGIIGPERSIEVETNCFLCGTVGWLHSTLGFFFPFGPLDGINFYYFNSILAPPNGNYDNHLLEHTLSLEPLIVSGSLAGRASSFWYCHNREKRTCSRVSN